MPGWARQLGPPTTNTSFKRASVGNFRAIGGATRNGPSFSRAGYVPETSLMVRIVRIVNLCFL